ncbi:hypothetical protein PENSUB_6992 [Penicillium subrubescens]|uniref:Uncharacterized protein n=1 Tax=Penicillium subrubescens TaxID=1316194 RepID=A0A1Q5TR43_9EURO|nr:hypothetical protein PENSUB_6992 [Penicillium subrubescens]
MSEDSALWSDSSDSESTVESIASLRELRDPTERYPIFFDSPGSNDFSASVDHPVDHPVLADHSLWSDSSDSESTVESIASLRELRDPTERYPIFFDSPGSNEFSASVDHLVDHPVDHQAPANHSPGPIRSSSQQPLLSENDSPTDSLSSVKSVAARVHFTLETLHSDAQYSSPSLWSQNLTGTNHYFREKKWDFFPELATPSAKQASLQTGLGLSNGKPRKDGRFNLAAKRRGSHSPDRAGLGLAQKVRDSVKTYVHRTLLSRPTTEPKAKD